MNSWSNWKNFSAEEVSNIPKKVKGVYVIRETSKPKPTHSDIIYIGSAGKGKQDIRQRLINLLRGIRASKLKLARHYHCASIRIKKHKKLEFSWVKCHQAPDGVEKAFLLAFKCSTGKIP